MDGSIQPNKNIYVINFIEMYVIGTAGHVDHGKSTLIHSLTGINPDRLAEEKERQMTIDLGFAWHTLPSGEEIGIVDVPGHRDFIDNMLAGVGGIDAVLFVVAADEGVMPQSREHLNIVKLLGIQDGLIVITKTDLVSDDEWMGMVEEDIRDLVSGTFLEDSPIVKVSAIKGSGLDVLSHTLDRILAGITKKAVQGSPRLPIDRAFSLTGFGTIVTGTLLDGSFFIGDEVILLPSGITSRIRGIQTHKKKQQVAHAGNRTAINLTGVDVEDILRGDVLCNLDSYHPSRILDVEIMMLESYPDSLSHNEQVKVFIGTAQKIARVRVIGAEAILPGQKGFAQLMVNGDVVARKDDRLILRRPSPPATIGGAVVVNEYPEKRYKRFTPEIINRFKTLSSGSELEMLLMVISDMGLAKDVDLLPFVDNSMDSLNSLLYELTNRHQLIPLEDGLDENLIWYMTKADWNEITNKVLKELSKYHRLNPLKQGADMNFIQNAIGWKKRKNQIVIQGLIAEKKIIRVENAYKLPDFIVSITDEQRNVIDKLLNMFDASGNQTPSVKDTKDLIGENLFEYLIDSGQLIQISSAVLFRPVQIETIINGTIQLIKRMGHITIADFRDHFNSSRKYAVALLEYMDKQHITIRDGDYRKLAKG